MNAWFPIAKGNGIVVFLDVNGRECLEIEGDRGFTVMEAFSLVLDGSLLFVVDRGGAKNLVDKGQVGTFLSSGYAKCWIGEVYHKRCGVVDCSGKWVVPPVYEGVSAIADGHYVAQLPMEQTPPYGSSLYTLSGQLVLPEFSPVSQGIGDGCVVSNDPNNLSLSGYRQFDGTWVTEPKYEFAYPFYKGMGAVNTRKGRRRVPAFVNREGKEIAYFKDFREFSPLKDCFSDDAISVWGKEVGFVDLNGDLLFSGSYELVGRMCDGAVAVMVDDLWGLMSRSGDWIIRPKFPRYVGARSGFFVFGDQSEWFKSRRYLMNSRGELLYEEAADGVSFWFSQFS